MESSSQQPWIIPSLIICFGLPLARFQRLESLTAEHEAPSSFPSSSVSSITPFHDEASTDGPHLNEPFGECSSYDDGIQSSACLAFKLQSSSESIVDPMGLEAEVEQKPQRKLKLLGLHGFRTSGDILRRQLSKLGPSLHELFDVDCLDAPLPCEGKSEVEGLFDGPYYEWYRFNKGYTEFYHVDETLYSYIADYMKRHGPFDGFLGFSQGAALSGCLTALQEKGLALQDVPPIRLLVLMAPAQIRAQHLKHVYEPPTIKCPTLALLGEKDWLKPAGVELLKSFENSITINHRSGHTVARLDDEQVAVAAQFFKSQLGAIDASDAPLKCEAAKLRDLTFKAADNVDAVASVNAKTLTGSHNEEVSVAA